MRLPTFFVILLLLAVAPAGFGGTVSSCANQSGAPFNINGTLYAYFTCSLYNDATSYTIPLTTYMTDGGASLANNTVGAGYFVVSSNPSQMFNQSYWQTVLYFPGDRGGGYTSDTLTVEWPGAFPSVAVVQSFNGPIETFYGLTDSDFFIQASAGYETVYQPSSPGDVYDIYATPEPGTIVLLGSSLALLSGVVLKRRRTAGRAA